MSSPDKFNANLWRVWKKTEKLWLDKYVIMPKDNSKEILKGV